MAYMGIWRSLNISKCLFKKICLKKVSRWYCRLVEADEMHGARNKPNVIHSVASLNNWKWDPHCWGNIPKTALGLKKPLHSQREKTLLHYGWIHNSYSKLWQLYCFHHSCCFIKHNCWIRLYILPSFIVSSVLCSGSLQSKIQPQAAFTSSLHS